MIKKNIYVLFKAFRNAVVSINIGKTVENDQLNTEYNDQSCGFVGLSTCLLACTVLYEAMSKFMQVIVILLTAMLSNLTNNVGDRSSTCLSIVTNNTKGKYLLSLYILLLD